MQKRTLKTLLLSLSTVIPTVILPFSLVSCGKKPDIQQVTVTFDAGEGQISSTQQKTLTIKVDKGLKWSDLKKPGAFWDKEHEFSCWTLDKETEVPVDHILNEDETFYAKYSDHEHDYSIYGVDQASNKMYVECSKCHHKHCLTDAELKTYENKLLVKKSDNSFYLSENSIETEIAIHSHDSTLDIYPIYGTYEISGSSTSTIGVSIHGLFDNSNNMNVTINCYIGYPIEMPGIELSIYKTYMQGAVEQSEHGFYFGLMPNELNCYGCYFLGQQTIYAGEGYFNDCVFDSSIFKSYYSTDEAEWKTEYALYLYNTYDEFENCQFVAKGKAVKIYSEGNVGGQFTFSDTTFHWIPDEEGKIESGQHKACIQVDSQYQAVGNEYYIFYRNLNQNETRPGVEVPLYADSSIHSYFLPL